MTITPKNFDLRPINIIVNMIVWILLSILTMSLPIHAQADIPKARMDDYIWEVVAEEEGFGAIYDSSRLCQPDNFASYQYCRQQILEAHDNNLIQQWGLADRMVRELDTLYINVPNRQYPLSFRENQSAVYEEAIDYLALSGFDKNHQQLLIEKQMWETSNTIVVDLNTGRHQEFYGSDLSFSPDGSYIVTVETYPDFEQVMLWKKDAQGVYHLGNMEDNGYDVFTDQLAFYNGTNNTVNLHKVNLQWLNSNSLLVDFYYKINIDDTVAYRVRFNYIKPDDSSKWQVIAVR
ncbi:hypothetical protein [Psychrobacter sp. I-STPA10]|uniref:hypothetical protein n=1 Tax=Psychrobacter sp. I-STPA10 TaxID=2585769 RepID=UPI001E5138C1|nr:hypothetical protein [Psychrobacter sp. I-STPA10]